MLSGDVAVVQRRGCVSQQQSRLNGLHKGHRQLDMVRARGRIRVRIHAITSIIVMRVQALSTGSRTQSEGRLESWYQILTSLPHISLSQAANRVYYGLARD